MDYIIDILYVLESNGRRAIEDSSDGRDGNWY
jgi:hypothetical protein